MKKEYTIEYVQKETFFVKVIAESEVDARCKASSEWENGNFRDRGDCGVEFSRISEIKNI